MSWLLGRPVGEHEQDVEYNRPYWFHGHHRAVPFELLYIEHDPEFGGWWQGGRKLRNFKPKKYWTRPQDGKRPGSWGRFKDALTGEGADVFVTLSGDKRTLMRDRPQRWQWTGAGLSPAEAQRMSEEDRDFRIQDLEAPYNTRFARQKRATHPRYNFKSRIFEYPRPGWTNLDRFWSKAQWRPGAKHSSDNSLTKQDARAIWRMDVPWWADMYPGCRPLPPWP